MKKIFILLSVLFIGKAVAQTTIFSETFGTGNDINAITQFTNPGGDWNVDDGSNAPNPPICPLGTGGSMLFGADASPATTFEEIGSTIINTSTFSNIRVTWNSLKANASSPAVIFEITTNSASPTWTPIAYTNNSTGNTWAAVPTVTLPNTAISTSLYLRWSYTSTGSSGTDYVAIDDIKVLGDGTPVFYWNGSGALNSLTSWGVNPTGSGTNPLDFTSPGQTFNIINAATATVSSAWTVSGAGTNVYIGDGSIGNQCALTIPSTAAITLNSGAKLNVTANSTLSILNTTFPPITSVVISTLSTVEWSQSSAVTIWSTTFGNLFLNGGGNKLMPSNNVTINGVFNLASGTNYVMVANATRLTRFSGPVTCAGSITTNFSSITIDGPTTNTVGTLNFTGTNPINNFIMNRSSKTVTLGNPLHILGTVTPSAGTIASGAAGNLYIRSTSTTKGRIGVVGGSITGNIKVETFAPGGVTDWANLGPSGVNGLTVASWEGQIPMTCFGCPNDEFSAGGYFVSVQGWDESQLANDPAAYIEMGYGDALSVGKGYWVYLGTGQSSTSDIFWTVTGPAIQGPQPISLTNNGVANGDGYNLISNPYASPISWTALRNANGNVDNAIYIYNADLGVTSAFVSGVTTPAGSGANDIIPMGQGFYVRASAATSLTAQESNKVASTNSLLKTSSSNIGDVIRLKIEGGGFSDETAIRFHNSTTSSFDKEWDAYKIFASPGYVNLPNGYTKRTTISTRSGNDDYAINSMPYAQTQNLVIPVLARVYATGQHTISAFDLQNIPANACVTLFDKLTNTSHNLKTGNYVCTINDTTATARFELTVCADITASVANNSSVINDNSIIINTDANGAYVKLDFDKNTKTKISVTNILGQKIIESRSLTAQKETIYLPLEAKNQLLFVTVETSTNKVTKKIIR